MSKSKFLSDTLAVTINEFRVLRRNRTAILLSLVVIPFFFTAALGVGSGGAGTSYSVTAKIPIAFIDDDQTVASGRVYAILARSGDFHQLIQGYREDNAIATLGTGKIYAVIVIPKGFQDRLLNDQVGHITVYVDDSVADLGSAIQGNLLKNLQDFNPRLEVQPVRVGVSSPIEIVARGVKFSGFDVGLTVILGLVIIFATFYEIAGGISRESEEGTYARLAVSPIGLGAIMAGKTFYDLGLNAVRALIVCALAVYGYGARPNTDLLTIVGLSLLMALLTMGFGFIISALGLGVRAVIIVEFFLVLFLFAFSGFIIDRELLTGFSKTISYSLPWAYGIEVIRRAVLIGQPLWTMANQLMFVVVSTVVFYGIAYFVLKISRERLVI
jgi:ABC-type multidrug transport system permease subunit